MTKNPPASLLQRLRNEARRKGISYQQEQMLFCHPEFLRRLSRSVYRDHLILKGGLFLYLVTDCESRPTLDADYLLHRQGNSEENIRKMLSAILQNSSPFEFVKFSIRSVTSITANRLYHGFQAKLDVTIMNERVRLNIDIGVGDTIVPSPQKLDLKTIPGDGELVTVLSYSVESLIAEKYDAFVLRMELFSRMKDIYDIVFLSQTRCFDGELLQKAIAETLQKRGTPHDARTFRRLSDLRDSSVMRKKWSNFRAHMNLKSDEWGFDLVMQRFGEFLEPPVTAMVNGLTFSQAWDCESGWA